MYIKYEEQSTYTRQYTVFGGRVGGGSSYRLKTFDML